MTMRTELLEVIAHGENSQVEFKRDNIRGSQLAKELVAFSNHLGGIVLLGVEDDRTIAGLEREGAEEWVMTTCRDNIRPGVIPSFKIVRDVEPGKDVGVVRVERAVDVHCMWHANRQTYFIRVGTQSREPSQEELRRLFHQRNLLESDRIPVTGAKTSDLDFRRLRDYFGRVREQECPNDDDEAGWKTFLVNSEILVEGGVSVAGLLLFGKMPNRHLPQAEVAAFAFPGVERDYSVRERTILRGPMTPLMDADGNLLESGLVEQVQQFVLRNTRVESFLEDGLRRKERPTYPDKVIREAIVNALIHRDYLMKSTVVEVSVYADRLEIMSPGELCSGMTPSRMRFGASSVRNCLLMNYMSHYGYIEYLGLGIPRRIIRGMLEHNGTDVDLVVDGNRFVVRLFAEGEKIDERSSSAREVEP